MSILHRSGDMFSTGNTVLAHGVNTHGVMGSGIAPLFRNRYPAMYEEYRERCLSGELQPGQTFVWTDWKTGVTVLNIASQQKPGRDARLEWIESGMLDAIDQLEQLNFDKIVISMPRIGCGIGGLDWDDVEPLLESINEKKPEVIFEVWTL
jgi:O-acetyl-ADP-ribose deacetylase (regulator of RNase III)